MTNIKKKLDIILSLLNDVDSSLTDDIEAAGWENDAKDSRYAIRERVRRSIQDVADMLGIGVERDAMLDIAFENRGRLMDAYVHALAEIAEGRENPVEFARFVLRQDANALIKMAVDVRNDAGKPEPEPETCVWRRCGPRDIKPTVGCRAGYADISNGIPETCPRCGKRVEVRE